MDVENVSLSQWLKNKVDSTDTILFDEGWDHLHKNGIQKVFDILKKGNDMTKSPFSTKEFSMLHNLTYIMSGHNYHTDYSLDLYHRCEESIKSFLLTEMIPMLKSSELSTAVDIAQVAFLLHTCI